MMGIEKKLFRVGSAALHSKLLNVFVGLSLSIGGCIAARASDVVLVGIFPGKAVLVVNGGSPRTIGVGGLTPEGVRLLSLQSDSADIEMGGKRSRVTMGERMVNVGTAETSRSSGSDKTVTLYADGRGHFSTEGTVNGVSVKFLVDTGATDVALGRRDAIRAGINFQNGEIVYTNTANGQVQAWQVYLNEVRIGNVVLHGVKGMVMPLDMPQALLGMSFLNRMEMRRDGSTMTLIRKY